MKPFTNESQIISLIQRDTLNAQENRIITVSRSIFYVYAGSSTEITFSKLYILSFRSGGTEIIENWDH